MSKLFSSLKIKDVTLKNRIVVSPMCQYSSKDGFANDWHLVHLGSRAVGGAGLVFTEAASVSPEGRISPEDLGIWKDEHIEGLKRITDFIHQQGSVAGIQLAHAGRKASTLAPWKGREQIKKEEGGWQTIAPSDKPFQEGEMIPLEMSLQEIDRVINAFKEAAERSLVAGFKVIEIHAAHGYLIHEFLSPRSNFRDDDYGGSFENRVRFLFKIISAVQESWHDNLPLFVRISTTEWQDEAWDIEDSIKLAALLKTNGVDLIDCSTGGNNPGVKIPLYPGYQVQGAEDIRSQIGIMTGAVGLITDPKHAEQILKDEKADLIFIAREFLRNPYLALDFAASLGDDIDWSVQYDRAKPRNYN